MRQFERLREPDFALAFARAVVLGKLANQRTLLLRHARRRGGEARLEQGARSLKAAGLRAELATSLDELRGCEGAGAAAYFRVFGVLVEGTGFRFDGRNRRPPMDPVNALLSLGYTLLMNVVEAAIEKVGLDPHLGALHAMETGRASLACDLVEELRAPVVDSLVVAALSKKAFELADFEDAGPGEPVVLKRETVRWMITLFERRMDRRVLHEGTGQRRSLHEIAELQARAFARHLLGEGAYQPYQIR
jgi:CRISPR-associated protein Cas1